MPNLSVPNNNTLMMNRESETNKMPYTLVANT